MQRLAHRDVKAVLTVLRGTYASLDPDDFARTTVRSLFGVIASDRCSYTELHRQRGMNRVIVNPPDAAPAGRLWEALSRHSHENPIVAYYRRTGRPPVLTFSDLTTRSQLHRLGLYREYYRHVDVEHQIVVPLTLHGSSTLGEIGFAISRRLSDFSARDRLVLELLQPHLVQAYTNSCALARMRATEAELEDALDAAGRGTILLGTGPSIRFASRQARRYLREYFGASDRHGERLPEDLARWIRQQDAGLADDAGVPAPRRPLTIAREGTQLTVRFSEDGTRRLLAFEERRERLDPESLVPLGLTRRESEVLVWVAEGKTNEEIGSILGARPSTVAKHLEHIYRTLGVETRTAAAVHAISVARTPSPRPG